MILHHATYIISISMWKSNELFVFFYVLYSLRCLQYLFQRVPVNARFKCKCGSILNVSSFYGNSRHLVVIERPPELFREAGSSGRQIIDSGWIMNGNKQIVVKNLRNRIAKLVLLTEATRKTLGRFFLNNLTVPNSFLLLDISGYSGGSLGRSRLFTSWRFVGHFKSLSEVFN